MIAVKGVAGGVVEMDFTTPAGTTGSVVLPGVQGSLVLNTTGQAVNLVDGVADGLSGGEWILVVYDVFDLGNATT